MDKITMAGVVVVILCMAGLVLSIGYQSNQNSIKSFCLDSGYDSASVIGGEYYCKNLSHYDLVNTDCINVHIFSGCNYSLESLI